MLTHSEVLESSEYIKTYLKDNDPNMALPEFAIIMGTGLGKLSDMIVDFVTIPYEIIPNFPISTVDSHGGSLLIGNLGEGGPRVVAMSGRFHYYEGYETEQVAFPVRVMKELGVSHLLVTNAAGGLTTQFMKKGSLMLIQDHINHLPSPLRGTKFAPTFPDMSAPYSKWGLEMLDRAYSSIELKNKSPLFQGVYVAVPGPQLETRAEYRALINEGADAVGMSTVPEVIVANQIGLPVNAISVITDECDPNNLHPVTLDEIIAVADKAQETLIPMVLAFYKIIDSNEAV